MHKKSRRKIPEVAQRLVGARADDQDVAAVAAVTAVGTPVRHMPASAAKCNR
jgi:hypothetical protein